MAAMEASWRLEEKNAVGALQEVRHPPAPRTAAYRRRLRDCRGDVDDEREGVCAFWISPEMARGICSGPQAENHRRQWEYVLARGPYQVASLGKGLGVPSIFPKWNAERKKTFSMETRLQIQTPSSLVILRLRRSQAAAGSSVSLQKLWLQIMAACRHRLCDLPRELHFLRAFLIYL
jgi:hypothetical protein